MHRSIITYRVFLGLLTILLFASAASASVENTRPVSILPILQSESGPRGELEASESFQGMGTAQSPEGSRDNDNCSQVTPYVLVPNVTTVIFGNNLGTTNDCDLLPGNGEAWQAFTLTECMDLKISFCGTTPRFGNVYTVLVDACPCGNLLFHDGWDGTGCGDGNFTIRWFHLAPGTYYYPILLDAFHGAAGPYQLNVTGQPCLPGYCPASGYICDEFISRVQLDSIDNGSGCSWYGDFTSLSTSMVQGTSHPITVTNGNPYSTDQCGVWVDWNNDFDFTDAGEQIAVSGTPGVGPYAADIVAPGSGFAGATRLRVRITDNGALNSCFNYELGEVEDYTVNIRVAYICGDANHDEAVDISDAVYLIAYIFGGGPAPDPLAAGDANCDLAVDISDAVYLIAYIFGGGPAPCEGCK